jgi:hypothetical protein
MPHSAIACDIGQYQSGIHKLHVDNTIRVTEKMCKAAATPMARIVDALSIINIVYGGNELLPGLIRYEIRTLGARYVDKPFFRLHFKFNTPHMRALRIFVQVNRDGSYVAQLYIPCKDILTEVSGSGWEELSLHLYMMLDQYQTLARNKPPRWMEERKNHPVNYRKV